MHPNYRLLCPLPIGVELVLPGQLLCSRQALRRHRVCNPSRSAGAASCGAAMRQLLRHSNAVHVRQRFHVLALPARRKIIEKRRRDVRLPTALQVLQEEAKSSAISGINSEPAREWPDAKQFTAILWREWPDAKFTARLWRDMSTSAWASRCFQLNLASSRHRRRRRPW